MDFRTHFAPLCVILTSSEMFVHYSGRGKIVICFSSEIIELMCFQSIAALSGGGEFLCIAVWYSKI
eukprot:TRINITY_DN6111_c0_g1_i1.p2 TRINITY_DN6111_c0_g1~~TRINITY_DN6111_c0_g1_i1.p2  ORF type:complete len:66 (+),score=6.34 TRINITY_DN6111_c0_g1_i1:44-241(+)